MKYYVSQTARVSGDGSGERPFKRISEAARLAVAGDEIIVGPGLYREHVNPLNGGDSDRHRIVYRSEQPGEAIISGAERITNWEKHAGSVWKTKIPNSLFNDYNPYTSVIKGDWYFSPKTYHTGEVYLNQKALYEAQDLGEVIRAEPYPESWDQSFSVYKWYSEQVDDSTVIFANFHDFDPNDEIVEINVRKYCFHPLETGVNYITVSGFTIRQAATQWAPPTAYQEGMVGPHWSKGWIIEDCDLSHSRCSGISLGKYLQPNNENKWTTKYTKDGTQTERDAICQARNEGWTKETIGSHIVRRCHIHDCGQTGIVGHLGGVFSIIEDNHIHHINCRKDLSGAEIGGIKMHAAIDVLIRRNHIHDCTRGLWLDWQAQGTRVSQNLFYNNTPPEGTPINNPLALGEDLFIEVSHGPTLVDNNLLLTDCAARLSTQGVAFVHNLIAGSFTAVGTGTGNGGVKYASERFTPYHVPHRTDIAGFMTFLHGDMRFYNNIFVQKPIRDDVSKLIENSPVDKNSFFAAPNMTCGTKPYDDYPTVEAYFSQFGEGKTMSFEDFNNDKYYTHLPVSSGGNVYFNGAQPSNQEVDYTVVDDAEISISIERGDEGPVLATNLYDYLPKRDWAMVSTELLGEAFEPEQKFENPDGSPITFNQDYFDNLRAVSPLAGPFEKPFTKINVNPSV